MERSPVTYEWQASCAVQKPRGPEARRFWGNGWRANDADRLRQAEACFTGGLIPERCSFGPRRLTLAGRLTFTPGQYDRTPTHTAMSSHAVSLLCWTLATVYGLRDAFDYSEPPGLRVSVHRVADKAA